MSSTARRNSRYALMDQYHIYGFPNPMPCVDWSTHLSMFKDENKDDAGMLLVRFHIHVCRLRVEFTKDFLMKMFMATLEDKARVWYEGLNREACVLLNISIEYFLNIMGSLILYHHFFKTVAIFGKVSLNILKTFMMM